MKRLAAALLISIVVCFPGTAFADEWRELPIPIVKPKTMCAPGEAFTFVMQCDPGTRAEIDRFHSWRPGVEICKVVQQPSCAPVIAATADARPGYEVQDSRWGELAAVIFGVDDLLGVQRR